MKFGLLYEIQIPPPWSEGHETRAYAEAMEQIVLADELGWDYVWAVEHHMLPGWSHSSAPEVFFGALSQRTSQIRLGHGIALLPKNFNHPVRVAERTAVLDILSSGRVDVGTDGILVCGTTGESATLSQGRTPLVSQIVEAAADLAHHATKLVGGVRWSGLEPGIRTSAPSTRAVPRLAAALATLATALGREGSAAGIDAAVEGEPEGGLRVHLTSPRSYDPSALAPFLQQAKGAVDVAPDGIRLDL